MIHLKFFQILCLIGAISSLETEIEEFELHKRSIIGNILEKIPGNSFTDKPYKPNTQICYEYVGCFSNAPPFNNAKLFLPIHPDILNTRFLLYTGNNRNSPELLSYKPGQAPIVNFNNQNPTKIVIHGFSNSGDQPWVIKMKNALIDKENGNVNVIVVDWKRGALFPRFFNATANTRLVGRQTCLVLKMLRDTFYNQVWSTKFNIHCIGHSLGAHTCAYASNHCEQIFDRISGMDPAGPNFEGTPIEVRIDQTDAKFVDVIHSNGDYALNINFGLIQPVGHVDFFPNGGRQQPGCPPLKANIMNAFNVVSCSHGRAYEYFIESILSKCYFIGYPCANKELFELGRCLDCTKGQCSQMGYHTSLKSRGIKYLATNSRNPFCTYPHILELYLNPLSPKTIGQIQVTLKADNTNITVPVYNTQVNLSGNNTYRSVFITDKDMNTIDGISFGFEKLALIYTNNEPLIIEKLRIHDAGKNEFYSECRANVKIVDKQSVDLDMKNCVFSKLNR